MRSIRSRKAFTLIELIVVIIIIGILAALAVVSYQAVINRSKDNQVRVAALSGAREVQALASFDAYGANGSAAVDIAAMAADLTTDAPAGISFTAVVSDPAAGTDGILVSGSEGKDFCIVLGTDTNQDVSQNTPAVAEAGDTSGPCVEVE